METYQDELRAAGVVRGERDCDERWSLLEPYIPDSGMMLDVGSNLGYFGLRSTLANPRLAVVSLEADPVIATRQSEIVSEHELDRMMVLVGRMNAAVAREWADSCDWFDATLLLAILHWVDDPAAVVAALSSMSGRLLCEVPDPADDGACGQNKLREWRDPVEWFARVTGRSAHHLGRVTRHTSDVPSHLIVVEGPVTRRPTRPYRGGPQREAGRYVVRHDGHSTTLEVAGTEVQRIPGVNLVNLMRLGALRYPDVGAVLASATAALDRHPDHPDPFPHNMLWGARGVEMIDFSPIDALLTAKDGRLTLQTHLPRWRAGRTVEDGSALRTTSLFNRLRSSTAGQAVLRRVPAPVRRRVRRALFGR